jgi:hypothetical protein
VIGPADSQTQFEIIVFTTMPVLFQIRLANHPYYLTNLPQLNGKQNTPEGKKCEKQGKLFHGHHRGHHHVHHSK